MNTNDNDTSETTSETTDKAPETVTRPETAEEALDRTEREELARLEKSLAKAESKAKKIDEAWRKRFPDAKVLNSVLETDLDFKAAVKAATKAREGAVKLRASIQKREAETNSGLRARLDAAWIEAETARKSFEKACKAFRAIDKTDWAEYLPADQQEKVLAYFGEGARIQTGETVSKAADDLDLNPRAVLAYLQAHRELFPKPADSGIKGKGAHTVVYRLSRPGLAKLEDLSADLDASVERLEKSNQVKSA